MTVFNVAASESLDSVLSRRGYRDVESLDRNIVVRLMYARADNFTGRVLYKPDVLSRAWLHPDAAAALQKAQKILSEVAPGTRLLVKDAARPMSVQRSMFDAVKGTPKANYVANPARGGGLHNFGLAVDITLADSDGRELPMGTQVDHLGVEANIDREQQMVANGIISETERQNRLLLRRVMREAGFRTIRTEWWHFNLCSLQEAKSRYKLIDF
ncbi:MAG: M15 family metallopeptidase [Muribaculaceae bacterium]|nr:M15 family metallopeptidase [Muribaculaceae bacterium]